MRLLRSRDTLCVCYRADNNKKTFSFFLYHSVFLPFSRLRSFAFDSWRWRLLIVCLGIRIDLHYQPSCHTVHNIYKFRESSECLSLLYYQMCICNAPFPPPFSLMQLITKDGANEPLYDCFSVCRCVRRVCIVRSRRARLVWPSACSPLTQGAESKRERLKRELVCNRVACH